MSENDLGCPIPRAKPKKGIVESKEHELCRRLEEYAEYAYNTNRMSDVSFYLEVRDFIETTTLGEIQ